VKTNGFCEVVKNTFGADFCKSDFLYILLSPKGDGEGGGVKLRNFKLITIHQNFKEIIVDIMTPTF
jgi:hypothetical protein